MQIVESQTLETECLPFSSIPHTTRLFDDFLHHFERVKQFYPHPPLSQDWWVEEINKIQYPAERRRAVAAVLERQNREFGAGEKTLANIERLRQGAAAVVTGQQVGLFRRSDVLHPESAYSGNHGGKSRRRANVLAGNRRPRS